MAKRYEWSRINNVLWKDIGMSPKYIARLLSNLPRGRKTYTKRQVVDAYSKIWSSPRLVSNFSQKLNKYGIKQ